jgi:hypothetical protein
MHDRQGNTPSSDAKRDAATDFSRDYNASDNFQLESLRIDLSLISEPAARSSEPEIGFQDIDTLPSTMETGIILAELYRAAQDTSRTIEISLKDGKVLEAIVLALGQDFEEAVDFGADEADGFEDGFRRSSWEESELRFSFVSPKSSQTLPIRLEDIASVLPSEAAAGLEISPLYDLPVDRIKTATAKKNALEVAYERIRQFQKEKQMLTLTFCSEAFPSGIPIAGRIKSFYAASGVGVFTTDPSRRIAFLLNKSDLKLYLLTPGEAIVEGIDLREEFNPQKIAPMSTDEILATCQGRAETCLNAVVYLRKTSQILRGAIFLRNTLQPKEHSRREEIHDSTQARAGTLMRDDYRSGFLFIDVLGQTSAWIPLDLVHRLEILDDVKASA